MKKALRANIGRFVPDLLRSQAQSEPFHGAVMFADISGFTALSEELARLGPAGAERLSETLDAFFEDLLGLLSQHGGHVIRIAGDAPLVAWEGPRATARAAGCALAIQRSLPRAGLALRIALASGELELARLGGVNDRWEWLLWGDCLRHLGPAGKLAQPGQVVLTPEAWAEVSARGQLLAGGYALLEDLSPVPVEPLPIHPLPTPEEAALLLRFLPAPARLRLEAGQEGWLAELRRVTVLFVNLRSERPVTRERLQDAVVLLQEVLMRHEGSLNQFLVDDKGTVCLAAFGLPPRAHHDDPLRAVRAALELASRMQDFEIDLGLTTGQLFCGPRGGSTRKEYCMIGSRVNLAARLMQAARGGILCDATTFEGCRRNLDFETLPPLRVKGKPEPLAVFRPLGEKGPCAPSLPLVGRESELGLLLARESGLVWLEGEPGIGKSRLLQELVARFPRQVLQGRAQGAGQDSPYHAWSFLDLPRLEHLVGEARAEATRDLIAERLRESGAGLLILEDAHWMDPASWDALFHLLARGWPGLIVVSTRPRPQPAELRVDLVLRLQPLAESAVAQLIAHLPGAPEPGSWLTRAQGNPFFAQELALAVAEGLDLPDSLQALIVSRIDRLVAPQQLALKVASVLGQRFSLVSLTHLYPIDDDRPALPDHAQGLAEREFVQLPAPGELEFRHDLTREVAYGLLLWSQRRELHRQAAHWFEESGLHPLLAYHWKQAADPEKAVHHFDLAGEQAHREGLYQAAVAYLEESRQLGGPEPRRLRLLGEAYHAAGNLAAARNCLEEAAARLGHPVARGWRLWLNVNMATMAVALGLRYCWPRGLGLLERALAPMMSRVPPVPEADQPLHREACTCHEALSVVYAYQGDMLASMHSGARTFELVAGCRPCVELARAYANSAMGLGLIGFFEMAEQFGRQAVAMPESHRDPISRTMILHYASMPLAITGRWEEALAYMRESDQVLETSGSRRQRAEMLAFLAYIAYYRGDLEGMQAAFARVAARALPDDLHHQSWIAFAQLFAAWVRGTPPAPAEVTSLKASDSLLQANLHGLAAVAAGPEALGHVEALLACKPPPEMAFYTSTAYEMAASAVVGLAPETRAIRALEKIQARLSTLALFIPVTEPLRWLVEARREEWLGRSGQRPRKRGLAAARRWNTPYYEGLLSPAMAL